MANTYVDYTATAAQQYFAFNFPYLEDEHVVVEIEGVDQTITTNYTIETSPTKRINLSNPTTALAGGELVRIKRRSAPNTNLVDFQNGSVLTESELDRAYLHNRYLAEEATEGADSGLKELEGSTNFNANNKQIKNLADGTLATDAVNKGYVDTQIALTDTNLAGFYKSTHTGNGTDNVFTLSFTPQTTDAKAYIVSIDGLVQVPDTDYTIGATAITFNTIPSNSAEICVVATAAASVATVNEAQVTATGSTTARSLASRFADFVNVKDYGATGDYHLTNNPTADDTTAIQNAITAATSFSPQKTLYFPAGNYKINTEITLPQLVSGDCAIIGDVKWAFNKQIKQSGRFRVQGNITLDSIWYSEFEYLEAINGNVKLESTDNQWGTFWNSFGTIICDLLEFNVDGGQSVNQNSFQNIRATEGVHVKGVNTSGVRECHNNVIYSLDTTGADLTATDTTTGHHILNDSDRNQSNTVVNWYAEPSQTQPVSFKPKVTGNWNILGSNVDASGHFVQVERENHYLFSGGTGRNGDYFAGSPINKARGGSFKQFKRNQLPIGLSAGGGVNFQTVSTTDSPDGNPIAVKFTGTASFSALSFSYPLGSSSQVGFTAFIKTANSPDLSVNVRKAGPAGGFNSAGITLQNVKNDWYLARFSIGADYLGSGSGQTNGLIQIFLTQNSVPSPNPEITLGSYFIATEQTAFLPQYEQGVKEIYDTTFPTAAGTIWEVGDVCWNTTPTAGGTPGWICVTAGSPGTWKAMASLAV
jgi:hypothetical protein